MSPRRSTDTRLDLSKRRADVASLTKRPECPCVDVFAAVTAEARCPHLDSCLHRSLVARKTIESFMRSVEAKTCTPVMIKVPLTPVSGIVTLLTQRPQAAFMFIILLMARPALRAGVLESLIFVAIFAGYVCVLTQ